MNNKKISSALISVYDKTGIEEVLNLLNKNGVTIYSTGGTYDFIKKLGIPVVSVESITDFPEILGGRVKTLHPKIFGGILNQRDSKSDQKEIKKHDIPHIDLVIVDLYPFEETVDDEECTHEEVIEKIDIGGISLIRAAAKNYSDVLVVSDKSQYDALLHVLGKDCSTELEVREEFAIDAFNNTSSYDNEIFKYLIGDDIQLTDNKSEKSSLNLNITKDDYNLNDFIFCWDKFGIRPNRIVVHNTYSSKLFNKVMSGYILDKNVFTEIMPDSEEVIINDKILAKIDEDCYLSYVVTDRNMDNSFIDSITFYYGGEYDGIQAIVEELDDCILDYCEDDSNKLNTIGISANGLEIEPISLKDEDIENTDLFYSTDTFKKVEKSLKSIKKSDKGLTIFYGERGTGKTTIINYLASKLDRIVIFIPNNMIEHTINNPEFRKFVKKYERPILVLDDCEMLFGEIFSRNPFANNLLQMVDGFLSDTMNVNIVALFNIDDEDEIDQSLLECNNLIDVIEFEYLSSEESMELAKHLKSNKKYKNKTKLVDIINRRSNIEEFEIGF